MYGLSYYAVEQLEHQNWNMQKDWELHEFSHKDFSNDNWSKNIKVSNIDFIVQMLILSVACSVYMQAAKVMDVAEYALASI